MSAQRESQEAIEKCCLGSDEKYGSACQKGDRRYPNSKCQGDHTESPVNFGGLNSTAIKTILQAVVLAQENDKTILIEDTIQSLGLNETEGQFLKEIIVSYVNYSTGKGFGVPRASSQQSQKYDNNLASVHNTLAGYHRNINDIACLLSHLQHPYAQREVSYQNLLNFEHGQSIVATDGEGDNDPECTKPPVPSVHHGRSITATSFTRYLMGLESKTSKEIHIETPVKGDYLLDFAKSIKPSVDKLSWREKCQESDVDFEASEEEGNYELLASPDLLYGREKSDNMADQSSICSLDDGIQHTKQAGDTDENQNNENGDSNSTGDSSSGEVADNDGDDVSPEGNAAPSPPDVADEGNIVTMETTPYGSNHELVGKDPPIQTSDDTADKSQLAGSQSYHLIQLQAPATKHHLLIDNGSGIAVPVDGSLENVTVSNLQDSNYHIEVEQAQEPLPLADPTFEPIIPLPKSLHNNSFYPFQPEDPFMPLCNKVDPPTETDSSIEDASSEISYVDAVEVSEDSCHQCSVSHHSVSPFVSPAAENVDNQSEEVYIEPPPKYGWWRDCRLL